MGLFHLVGGFAVFCILLFHLCLRVVCARANALECILHAQSDRMYFFVLEIFVVVYILFNFRVSRMYNIIHSYHKPVLAILSLPVP